MFLHTQQIDDRPPAAQQPGRRERQAPPAYKYQQLLQSTRVVLGRLVRLPRGLVGVRLRVGGAGASANRLPRRVEPRRARQYI